MNKNRVPLSPLLTIGSFLLLAGIAFGPEGRFRHHQALGVVRDSEAVRAEPWSVFRYHGAFIGDPYVFYRHGMRVAGKSVPLSDLHLIRDKAGLVELSSQNVAFPVLPYRDFEYQYPEAAALYMAMLGFLSANFDAYYNLLRVTQLLFFLGVIYSSYESTKLMGVPSFSGRRYLHWVGVIALATGPRWLCYYDFLPAFCVGLLLYGSLSQRWILAGGSLTVGILSKLFPVFLVPIVIVLAWRDDRWRSIVKVFSASLITGLLILSPWLVLAPRHTLSGIRAQAARQYTEIGSGLGSVLLVGRSIGAWSFRDGSELDSRVAISELSRTVAGVSVPLLLVSSAAVCVWFLRRKVPQDRTAMSSRLVVTSFLLVLCTIYLFAKVFSPQYVVWAIPIVLVVASFSWRAAVSFSVAGVLIQIQFPYLWALDPVRVDPLLSVVLMLRNLCLVLAACFAVVDATRYGSSPRTVPGAEGREPVAAVDG